MHCKFNSFNRKLDFLTNDNSIVLRTALAGKGKGVDNEAKEVIIQLLNKTVLMAQNIEVESPEQLFDFCQQSVGTMGGIVSVSVSFCQKNVTTIDDSFKSKFTTTANDGTNCFRNCPSY